MYAFERVILRIDQVTIYLNGMKSLHGCTWLTNVCKKYKRINFIKSRIQPHELTIRFRLFLMRTKITFNKISQLG